MDRQRVDRVGRRGPGAASRHPSMTASAMPRAACQRIEPASAAGMHVTMASRHPVRATAQPGAEGVSSDTRKAQTAHHAARPAAA